MLKSFEPISWINAETGSKDNRVDGCRILLLEGPFSCSLWGNTVIRGRGEMRKKQALQCTCTSTISKALLPIVFFSRSNMKRNSMNLARMLQQPKTMHLQHIPAPLSHGIRFIPTAIILIRGKMRSRFLPVLLRRLGPRNPQVAYRRCLYQFHAIIIFAMRPVGFGVHAMVCDGQDDVIDQ